MQERVQKLIAAAGIASRREAEELIRAGRVSVNGRAATLGTKADLLTDDVRLDGERIGGSQKPYYLVLYKPLGCLTTMHDEEGRFCVGDLLRHLDVRLFPVGRLDGDSEGLLLLTNDGEFANRITHPRYEVPKSYLVKVSGKPGPRALARLRQGVVLEDGPTLPAKAEIERRGRQHDWLKITVFEGRNRIIRRMCQAVGHPVIKLKRVGVGPVSLEALAPGEWRRFRPEELRFVEALKQSPTYTEGEGKITPARPKKPARGKGFARAKKPPVKPGYKAKKRAAQKRAVKNRGTSDSRGRR